MGAALLGSGLTLGADREVVYSKSFVALEKFLFWTFRQRTGLIANQPLTRCLQEFLEAGADFRPNLRSNYVDKHA